MIFQMKDRLLANVTSIELFINFYLEMLLRLIGKKTKEGSTLSSILLSRGFLLLEKLRATLVKRSAPFHLNWVSSYDA